MKFKFELNFFLARLRISKEVFFEGVLTMEDALLLMDQNNVVSYDYEEVSSIVSKNKADAVFQLEKNKKPKKAATRRKTGSNSVRKTTRTRTRKKASSSKKQSGVEKVDEKNEKKDSSYFKTWKVPYVEPE